MSARSVNSRHSVTLDREANLQIKELERELNYYEVQLEEALQAQTFPVVKNETESEEIGELKTVNATLAGEIKELERELACEQRNSGGNELEIAESLDQTHYGKMLDLEQQLAMYRKENQELRHDNQKLWKFYTKVKQEKSSSDCDVSVEAHETEKQQLNSSDKSMHPPLYERPLPAISTSITRECEKCRENSKLLDHLIAELQIYDDAFREKKLEYLNMFEAFKKMKLEAHSHIKLIEHERDEALEEQITAREELIDSQKQQQREKLEIEQKLEMRKTKKEQEETHISALKNENEELQQEVRELNMEVTAFQNKEIRQTQAQDLTSKLRLENDTIKRNFTSVQYESECKEKAYTIQSLSMKTEISNLKNESEVMRNRINLLENEGLKSQRIIKLEAAINQYCSINQERELFLGKLEEVIQEYSGEI